MFQTLTLQFNNENIGVTLPDKAYDIDGIQLLDMNDITRIRIVRDCKWVTYLC